MNPFAKWLVVAGAMLMAVGLLWQIVSKIGLGRLPGDIVVERENFRFYFPLATSLLVSLLASLAWYALRRFIR